MSNVQLVDHEYRIELKKPLGSAGSPSLLDQLQKQLRRVLEQMEDLTGLPNDLRMLVIPAQSSKELERIEAVVKLIRHRILDLEHSEMERLIEISMPEVVIPQPDAVLDQARRNAALRARFLKNFECLDAEGVHKIYGSKAENTAALAAKWRKEGRIFGMEYRSKQLHPVFQFDEDGKPKPIIKEILGALGAEMGPWQKAIWFTAENPLLGRRRPADLLEEDPEEVLRVASQLSAPNLF